MIKGSKSDKSRLPARELDNLLDICYNRAEAHPIIRAWIGQLLASEELASILKTYGYHRIDVTLSASSGKAVLKPEITIRKTE